MRCMILSAGFGTRLNPLTIDLPKPLMEILGTPIIELQLRALRTWRISEVMINTHYLADQLQARLGDEFSGIRLFYSHEHQILGSGGGLKKVQAFFADQKTFLLVHGDVLIDLDFSALTHFHERHQPISTMVLKNTSDFLNTRPVGTDYYGRISNFLGAKTTSPTVKERMFCGVHALSPAIFSSLPPKINYCITAGAYPQLVAQGGPIMGFAFDDFFCDIGTIDQYFNTNMSLLSGAIRLKTINLFSRYRSIGPILSDGTPNLQKTIWLGKNVTVNLKNVTAPCIIDDDVTVGTNAKIGPYAILGKKMVVEDGASVKNSILLSDSRVRANEVLDKEIRSRNHSSIIDRKQFC